jgi:Pyruvate/2-oxoacid:ferredoxin oxidoreductase gamma subunit
MVGAVVELTGIAKLENLAEAIRSAVPVKVNENAAAAQKGAEAIRKYRLAEDRSREHVNA